MTKYYFIWNSINSASMGIVMREHVPIVKPEERVEHVTIPGRSGELTLTEGDDIYQSYIQTVHIAVNGKSQARDVEKWLRGGGVVTFSTQPEYSQKARIIGAVTMEKHSSNLDWWEGDVQFYCEPLKSLLTESTIEITESGTAIQNLGDVIAKPKIQIRGTGAITITDGGKTLTIENCHDKWIADSETEWVTNNSGTPQESAFTGEFPLIPKGTSSILFTGSVTKLVITPRWKFI